MNLELIDRPTEIRDGEGLPVEALSDYLRQVLASDLAEDKSAPIRIRQFPGGASNLTYQIDIGSKAYILRRPPFGKFPKAAHDMLREARIVETVKPYYSLAPDVLHICQDHDVMGCDFYLMRPLQGIIIREQMPASLVLSPEQHNQLCRKAFDRLIELHEIDVSQGNLSSLGKGEGYVERQVLGTCSRYAKARTDDVPDFEKVADWVQKHMPEESRLTLIHNDFRLDNLVLDPQDPMNIIGVLDWELATIGDPLMDLGVSMAYWVEADDHPVLQAMRRQPSHLPGMMTRQEIIDYYLTQTSSDAQDFTFYQVFGIFRLAMIVQQIYYRFYHGQTKDPRFANMNQLVIVLEQQCLSLIKNQQKA